MPFQSQGDSLRCQCAKHLQRSITDSLESILPLHLEAGYFYMNGPCPSRSLRTQASLLGSVALSPNSHGNKQPLKVKSCTQEAPRAEIMGFPVPATGITQIGDPGTLNKDLRMGDRHWTRSSAGVNGGYSIEVNGPEPQLMSISATPTEINGAVLIHSTQAVVLCIYSGCTDLSWGSLL